MYKCKDCKWLEASHWVHPVTGRAVNCYVCLCERKRRWYKMKRKGFQYMEPSHVACKTGFELKENHKGDAVL